MKVTLKQFIERNLEWADALEENSGKECRGKMRDTEGNRCCLAVAEDVKLQHEPDADSPEEARFRSHASASTASWFGWDKVLLPHQLRKNTQTGYAIRMHFLFGVEPYLTSASATELNDDLCLSHLEIAKKVRCWVDAVQSEPIYFEELREALTNYAPE